MKLKFQLRYAVLGCALAIGNVAVFATPPSAPVVEPSRNTGSTTDSAGATVPAANATTYAPPSTPPPTTPPSGTFTFPITANASNLNLFTYANSPTNPNSTFYFIVKQGITVGTVTTGVFPSGNRVIFEVEPNARASGAGGKGGNGCGYISCGSTVGSNGTVAITANQGFDLINNGVVIGGGTGGSGGQAENYCPNGEPSSGSGGGGGGGYPGGAGGNAAPSEGRDGQTGQLTAGGAGGTSIYNCPTSKGTNGAAPGSAFSLKKNGFVVNVTGTGTIGGIQN